MFLKNRVTKDWECAMLKNICFHISVLTPTWWNELFSRCQNN